MFTGFTDRAADFFWALSLNNNREWFLAHKDEFEQALNQPFRALASDTFERMQARFPDLELYLHAARIYRDARRTYGKGPYKEQLWFTIQPDGPHPVGPLFWFEIDGTSWSCGAGFWDCPPEQMAVYRAKIDAEPSRFERLVAGLDAMGGCKRWGEVYKRPKADRGPILNPWYNLKHISVGWEYPHGGQLYAETLPDFLTDAFARLMPMYLFLREVYAEYQHLLAEREELAGSGRRLWD